MTSAQRTQYEANGFLRIPNALTAAQLAAVQSAANRAEELWRTDATRPGSRSETLHQVQCPIEYDDALLGLLWHPTTFPIVRAILGDDVMMIDNDYFITPPRTPRSHADWHHDVGMSRIHHPLSTLMVKVFFLLSDMNASSGGTAMIPGSHKFPESWEFPRVDDPKAMPGAIQMAGKAGDAYLFNARIYHCAVNNESDDARRVLIYNYGHFWMKMWSGHEPSARLISDAMASVDPVRKQLLGIGDAYGQRLPDN